MPPGAIRRGPKSSRNCKLETVACWLFSFAATPCKMASRLHVCLVVRQQVGPKVWQTDSSDPSRYHWPESPHSPHSLHIYQAVLDGIVVEYLISTTNGGDDGFHLQFHLPAALPLYHSATRWQLVALWWYDAGYSLHINKATKLS